MPKFSCPLPDCTFETEDYSRQRHTHKYKHSSPSQSHKTEKIRRPTISIGGSSEEWTYFLTRWQDYAEATNIDGKEKVIQLLECCDDNLRKDLTRCAGGSLASKPITEVMAAIKKLAVREESTMVARVELHNMQQDRDEPIRNFGARLRGQAGVCKFTTKCPNCDGNVDYTEHIIRDVLTRGLADQDIQLDLLGDKNQNMTLEEVFQFIEAKEAGRRSANRLLETQTTSAARSQYRKAKQEEPKRQHPDRHEKCYYCGQRGHGKRAPPTTRKTTCPAYGKTCGHCGRPNHFDTVCQHKEKTKHNESGNPRTSPPNTESGIFDSLCTTTSTTTSGKTIALDHHLYNNLNDCWVRQASKPQPYVKLTATLCPEDYSAFGLPAPSSRGKSINTAVMADTGCQSCLASLTIIKRLGLRQTNLIPVTMRMYAANNKGITILGATILRFSGKCKSGATLETRQITYVTDSSAERHAQHWE